MAVRSSSLRCGILCSLVASAPATCTDQESCLALIDQFAATRTRQSYMAGGAGLLQIYGPTSFGGGPCGPLCELPAPCESTTHCRYDVYDNALAAIYLAKRGRLAEAKHILDAFTYFLYPTFPVNPAISFGPDGIPSGKVVTLLAASYTELPARPGDYEGVGVADGGVDTGNNAWVGMAFAHYAVAANSSDASMPARDILAALKSRATCSDARLGFLGRLNPYPNNYRSTEHNIDMFALARMLGDDDAQHRASVFVGSMYASPTYATGTNNAVRCDASVTASDMVAADTQVWNMLSDVDATEERKVSSIGWVTKAKEEGGLLEVDTDLIGNQGAGIDKVLSGFRFSSLGSGIQWEIAISTTMSLIHYTEVYGVAPLNLSSVLEETRRSAKHVLSTYGCMPATIRGGNYEAWLTKPRTDPYPGGSDSGIGWTYLRYPHLASTMWMGFLLMYQPDATHPVDPAGNPFLPSSRSALHAVKKNPVLLV